MSNFNFQRCAEVNPFLNEAVFTASDNTWDLYIPKLDIRFTDKPTIMRIIHSGLRSIVSDYNANKGAAVPEHIALQLSVWKESGKYLTPKEKENAIKKVTVSQTTGKPVKLPYGRIEIESAMRQVTRDDPRIPIVEAMDDEQFSDFMVLCATEDFVIDALDHLAKRAKEKAEREASDKKAAFMAMLAKAK